MSSAVVVAPAPGLAAAAPRPRTLANDQCEEGVLFVVVPRGLAERLSMRQILFASVPYRFATVAARVHVLQVERAHVTQPLRLQQISGACRAQPVWLARDTARRNPAPRAVVRPHGAVWLPAPKPCDICTFCRHVFEDLALGAAPVSWLSQAAGH